MQEALRFLLGQKALRDISIEELTRRAGVTRPTFYSNYAGMSDMLDAYLSSLLEEIDRQHKILLEKPGNNDGHKRLVALVSSTLNNLDRDDPRLLALFNGAPAILVEHRFALLVQTLMNRSAPDELNHLPACEHLIVARYFSGAFLGIIRLWVERPDNISADLMARTFADLALNATQPGLGV